MDKRLTDGVDTHHMMKRAVAKHKSESELDEDADEAEDHEEESPDPSAWKNLH